MQLVGKTSGKMDFFLDEAPWKKGKLEIHKDGHSHNERKLL